MEEDTFTSLNRETGVLEGDGALEDTRRVVDGLVKIIRSILTSPIGLLMPEGMKLDVAAMAAGAETLIKQTSEADYMRSLMKMVGYSDMEASLFVAMSQLSPTLPATHPSLKKLDPLPLNENDPVVRGSIILSLIAREDKEKKGSQPGEIKSHMQDLPPVDLPPNLDSFLDTLIEAKGEPHDTDKNEEEGGD